MAAKIGFLPERPHFEAVISAARFPILIRLPLNQLKPQVQQAIAAYLEAAHPALKAKEVPRTDVRLQGDISLWEDGERLITEIPLSINIRVLPKLLTGLGLLQLLDRVSLGVIKSEPIHCAIRLRLHTRLQLRPDGSLHSATTATFDWSQKPLAGRVSLAGVIGPMIENQLPEITLAVDEVIPRVVSLPQWENDIWTQLHRWERIESAPPLWFRLAPEQRETDRQLRLAHASLECAVVLQGRPQIRLQQNVPPQPAIPPLPEGYAMPGDAPQPQQIEILSSPAELNAFLRDQTFSEGEASLEIRSPQLHPKDDHWELRLQLSGSLYRAKVEGELSIFVQIHATEERPILELIDYQLHTASIALRLALYWWSKAKLQALLQTELEAILRQIEQAIQAGWNELALPPPFAWQPNAIAPRLQHWELQAEQLRLVYTLEGTAVVVLGDQT